LLHGRRDGKIVIENVNPKQIGGKHKVLDEKFNDSERLNESNDVEIDE
jgi:hypothetical protein